ncbi:cytochrome P450 [Collybia nuda]|uniref:Cytochrome P450 n=1 Tax=Collybia nuda TaxID=64659 RepID=A0A9P6CFG7_9AGAR|nr:cytochrome P450 [Collybia nuda]
MALLLFSFLLFRAIYLWTQRPSKHPPLPPGPPRDPIVGHLRLILADDKELLFQDLGKKYGGIIHLSSLGRSVIVLNDLEMATDLLDGRASKYSGRLKSPLCDIVGLLHTTTFLNDEKDHQLHRRVLQKHFNLGMASSHRPIQVRAARMLAQNLISAPSSQLEVLKRFAIAVLVQISYGHVIETDDDPYFTMVYDVIHHVLPVLSHPKSSAVDLIPLLRYLPSWFPGTYCVELARSARPFVDQLYQYPITDVIGQMEQGTAKPSFLVTQLEALQRGEADHGMSMEHIQAISTILQIVGAETTAVSLSAFVFAMALHPECQKKAQEEIDKVVGAHRLPDFSDRLSLPYLECILQETLRWCPATPLGVPHLSLEDDIYNGMLIPKGSIVIANVRGMGLDESIYTDPLIFNPDRFLRGPSGRGEPHLSASFGFGRRICPGRFLAHDSIWIAVTTVLAVFSISKEFEDDWDETLPTPIKQKLDGNSTLLPYRCHLQPRNGALQSLLE